jgi:hypothetical protein
MADIEVTCVTAANGWLCRVTVVEGGSETRHSVTLTRADFRRLTTGGGTPEGLVRRSFEFLLAREPRESILRTTRRRSASRKHETSSAPGKDSRTSSPDLLTGPPHRTSSPDLLALPCFSRTLAPGTQDREVRLQRSARRPRRAGIGPG